MIRTRWILVGYLFILLVGMLMYLFIPNHKITTQTINANHMEQIAQENHEFYNAALNGDFQQLKSVRSMGQQTFAFQGEQLTIKASNQVYQDIWIFIERKDTNDNLIELEEYATRTLYNGIEFTDHISEVNLRLQEEQLWLEKPSKLDYKFIEFRKEFTLTQFTSKKPTVDSADSNFTIGHNIIYLKVPQKLKIIDESYFRVVFVD